MEERHDPPILPAYERTGNYYVWCEHCYRWHIHGAGNGHRVAHCQDTISPYSETGYSLQYAGELTPEIERDHGHRPKEIQSLSHEHLKLWSIVYGDERRYPRVDAKKLLHLFTLNNIASAIPDNHVLEQRTHLTWQLSITEQVSISKKTKPWTFHLYLPTLARIISAPELMAVIFPEDTMPAETWMKENIIEQERAILPVWWAWNHYQAWARQKGKDYQISRKLWKDELTHDTPMQAKKIRDYTSEVFVGFRLKNDDENWWKL